MTTRRGRPADPRGEQPLAAFGVRTGLLPGVLVVGLFFLALATGLPVVLVQSPPKPDQVVGVVALVGSMEFLFLVMGVGMLIAVLPYLGLRVVVYPSGLERRSLWGRGFWGWDEISLIWYRADRRYMKGLRPLHPTYVLECVDGRRCWVGGEFGRDGWELGDWIERQTTDRLLTEARAAVDRGEVVRFGPLAVSPTGLRLGEDTLPWGELAEADVGDGGRFVVRKQGSWKPWLARQASAMPNLLVFFGLLPRAAGRQGVRLETVTTDSVFPTVRGEPAEGAAPVAADPTRPLHESTLRAPEWRGRFGGGVLLLLAGAGLMAGAVALYLFDPGRGGWWPLVLAVGGVVAVVASVPILQKFWGLRDWRVLVFEDGLSEVRGGRETRFRWEDVEEFWSSVTRYSAQGEYAGTEHEYRVRLRDGRDFRFTFLLRHLDKLGDLLREKTHAPLLARALSQLKAGSPVAFGTITVGPDGVRNGKDLCPWNEFGGAALQTGWLHLFREGSDKAWGFHLVADVPNVFVLVHLLEVIHGSGHPPSR